MIRTALFETMIALREMQPATVSLVSLATGVNESTVASRLCDLVELQLATRRKFDPFSRAPLTAEERRDRINGMKDGQGRTGKRPWLYELTPDATMAAEHLHHAMQLLETANDERQQQTRRTA